MNNRSRRRKFRREDAATQRLIQAHRFLTWFNSTEFRIAKTLHLMLELVVRFGSTIAILSGLTMGGAAAQAHAYSFNMGASPTSQTSGNMPQAFLSTFYNTRFLENLKANLVSMRQCTRREMPMNAGANYRSYMNPVLPANTTQQTEGTVGSGVSITTNFIDYVMGQWADFLNISDKAQVTSVTQDMVEYRKEMAYRLAISIDDLIMAMFDYLITLDSKTNTNSNTVSPYYFSKSMIEQAPYSLEIQNVKPVAGGYYAGKIHPAFVGDLLIDTSNNSIVDIMKHTHEGLMKLEELPTGEDGDEVGFLELFGCRWMKSTNCTQTPNYLSSGATAFRTYLAGKDAMVAVELGRHDKTKVGDNNYQNLTLWMGTYAPGQSFDPAGVIGAGTSYNAILGFGPPPDTTSRARCWDAVPQTT